MAAKVQVFYVAIKGQPVRLIRGTRKQVETKLFNEIEMRPASADEAHTLHATKIESAEDQP